MYLTVPPSISTNAVNTVLYVGGSTYQPSVTLSGNRSPFTFTASSSNTSVATVSDPGSGNPRTITISPVASGNTTIIFSYSDGTQTATQTFTINAYGKKRIFIFVYV